VNRYLLAAFTGCAVAAATLPTLLNAYDLKPIVVQLTPSGAGAAQQMTITNSHKVPIAIEVKAYRREQLPDGSDKLTAENNDIIISPPQMVIQPGSSQAFKVRWIGDPNPAREQAFRIVTTQLPINFKSQQNGGVNAKLNLTYKYEAALYVVPKGSAPSAALTGAAPVKDEKGVTWLELTFQNSGNARALLHKPVITLRSATGGNETVMSGPTASALENFNILAGSERKIRLPWPEGLAEGPLTGALETEYTVLR